MGFALGCRILFAASMAATLATGATAQGTTGIPGINDYLVAGGTSGSSSCTVRFPVGPGLTTFSISTAPSAPVVFLFNVGSGCACKSCFFPWSPSTGCGMGVLGCFAGSNQAFELNSVPGCSLLVASTSSNTAGLASISLFLPVGPYRFSTQGVLLHPCDTSTLIFTQAYDVSVP